MRQLQRRIGRAHCVRSSILIPLLDQLAGPMICVQSRLQPSASAANASGAWLCCRHGSLDAD